MEMEEWEGEWGRGPERGRGAYIRERGTVYVVEYFGRLVQFTIVFPLHNLAAHCEMTLMYPPFRAIVPLQLSLRRMGKSSSFTPLFPIYIQL